ncbi:MAG: rhodanese-like domain-containing protein [Thermoanaerobaculia bacterium]
MSPGAEFEIDPLEAAGRRGREEAVLLDVREEFEREIAAIEGSLWIPMREIPSRAAELPRDREIIVFCHHGGRSAQVAMYLLRNGHSNVRNLSGGIDAWSTVVDNSVRRY